MSNEISLSFSLSINKDNTKENLQRSFQADMASSGGPSPGMILVSTVGVNVDFSALTLPGVCLIRNLDTVNYLEYGIWDPETSTFYPLGEVLPGEEYMLRLSRRLALEYGTGPGTGSIGPATNRLRLRAYNSNVRAVVRAFEA